MKQSCRDTQQNYFNGQKQRTVEAFLHNVTLGQMFATVFVSGCFFIFSNSKMFFVSWLILVLLTVLKWHPLLPAIQIVVLMFDYFDLAGAPLKPRTHWSVTVSFCQFSDWQLLISCIFGRDCILWLEVSVIIIIITNITTENTLN